VGVYESRSDDESFGVNCPTGRHCAAVTDENDPITADSDVGRPRGAARAVDDGSAANQEVDALLRGHGRSRNACDA
jgi:hypothetical protein